ncbi:MAG: hypothetical protein V4665_00700 [Patescibacteria group bacterium]
MGLFSSAQKEHGVAIFDIGSGSVGGAYVRLPKNADGELPTIVASSRTEITERGAFNLDRYMDDMTRALCATADVLYKSAAVVPTTIVCVLASPWHLSETRIIKTSRENPFVFTKRLADELIQKEVTFLSHLYKEKYGTAESELELFEQRIVGIALNGYPVSLLDVQKTRTVEISMAVSAAPKACLDAIRLALSSVFHDTPVSFSSFVLSSYLAVRDRYISLDSYILIDIGGEVTDIAFVSQDVLTTSISFPVGKRHIYSHLADKAGIEYRDAQEVAGLYLSGILSHKKKESLGPIFASMEKLWLDAFRKSISAISASASFPETIFLTADADVEGWFAGLLRNEEYLRSLRPDREVRVVSFSGPEFLNMCAVKNTVCDPFLMIEAISVARKMEK